MGRNILSQNHPCPQWLVLFRLPISVHFKNLKKFFAYHRNPIIHGKHFSLETNNTTYEKKIVYTSITATNYYHYYYYYTTIV